MFRHNKHLQDDTVVVGTSMFVCLNPYIIHIYSPKAQPFSFIHCFSSWEEMTIFRLHSLI